MLKRQAVSLPRAEKVSQVGFILFERTAPELENIFQHASATLYEVCLISSFRERVINSQRLNVAEQ